MKKFILFIGLILNTLIGFSQIEFQGILYTDYSPGVKIEFEVINTSLDEIETIHIQLRRLLPTTTPAFGSIYHFNPPLQSGELRWIDPFDYCVDAHINFTTEFEAKIYNIDGQIVQIPQVLGQIFTEVDGCATVSDVGAFQIFCEECGVLSSIEETDNTELIFKTEYYTTVGQNVPFEELQPNVLYIIKETTQTGFKIYKTIIQ